MNIHRIYLPFLRYFRTKRMRKFWREFRLTPHTRVLDVGGSMFNWNLISGRPNLVLLNLTPQKGAPSVVADGRYVPFEDGAFDTVYSNSVIEHLGSIQDQRLFADECQRVGNRYYVQTPNRRFPIEPHFIAPFIHWLPRRLQTRLLRNFTIWGMITRPTRQQCDQRIDQIRLLDEEELRTLFPDGEILREHFLGLVKSLIAVKDPA